MMVLFIGILFGILVGIPAGIMLFPWVYPLMEQLDDVLFGTEHDKEETEERMKYFREEWRDALSWFKNN